MKTTLFLILLSLSVAHAGVITGWVSEENCKEQHTNPGGKDCVKKCLRGGADVGHPEWTAQKIVFIQEADKKIWSVRNPELLEDYAGERISLSAKTNSDTNMLEVMDVLPYHKPVPFRLFRFRNGFWINLHHFLRGSARRELHPESKNEVKRIVRLDEEETAEWNEALEYYKANFAEKDLLFDEDLWPIKNWVGDAENNADLEDRNYQALAAILKKAAPVYRKHWWPEHQRANQEWIRVAQRLLDQFGTRIAKPLEEFYGEKWPNEFLVDVTVEAGWAGAYTTDNPVRITCSSRESKMQDYAALETLFHEASHSRDRWLSDKLNAASAQTKVNLPDRFWHAVLFYTAGEMTRKELEQVGIHEYVPLAYKNNLYQKGWQEAQCAIEKEWAPKMSDPQWQKLVLALNGCK